MMTGRRKRNYWRVLKGKSNFSILLGKHFEHVTHRVLMIITSNMN